MRLKDLIECDIVKDNHKIIISQRVIGTVKTVARGNWYQDHILNYQDQEIYSLSYKSTNYDTPGECKGIWTVTLRDSIG